MASGEAPNADCVDLEFSPGDPTGVVVCDSTGRGSYDLFVSRWEPCNGRGFGESVATRPPLPTNCKVDADCPAGSTCSADSLCRLPLVCDGQEPGSDFGCVCAGFAGWPGINGYSQLIGHNQWVPTECRSDADCRGFACALSISSPCGELDGAFCHSGRDECATAADCGIRERCAYDAAARHWHCIDAAWSCDRGLF